nr:alpha-glucosidase/alpha-galactosidase [Clostridia bacterium]
YCTHGTNWNPGEYAYILKSYFGREDTWKAETKKWLEQETVDIKRGHEYAAYIFKACFGDNTMFKFNGNVRNFGLIDNLPEGCCVEVPVLASKNSLEPIHVGKLPEQLAVLINTSARCEELAVEGAIEGDKRKIFHAVLFDPLTSAVLSMAETKAMVDEMFEAGKDYLGYFK